VTKDSDAPRPAAARADTARADVTLAVSAIEGLKFSVTRLDVRPGARVRLTLENASDMPHNLVVVSPGRADAVHEASMRLGIDGAAMQYVPRTRDVLFHTRLVDPGKRDTLTFRAPTTPGEYPFLCTFPGHGIVMRGVLRVGP
jgi:azurin